MSDGEQIKKKKGRITWIEFDILYILHGGGVDIEKNKTQPLLSKTPSLRRAVADFKKG